MRVSAVMLCTMLCLAGCDEEFVDPDAAAETEKERPAETLLDDHLRYIDRAKAVEGDVLENKERLDAAVEAATGG